MSDNKEFEKLTKSYSTIRENPMYLRSLIGKDDDDDDADAVIAYE